MKTKRRPRTRATLSPDEIERRERAILATVIEQEEAEALQDYLARGRRFEHLDVEPLKAQMDRRGEPIFSELW
jgi:hypothetical protein